MSNINEPFVDDGGRFEVVFMSLASARYQLRLSILGQFSCYRLPGRHCIGLWMHCRILSADIYLNIRNEWHKLTKTEMPSSSSAFLVA